MKSYVFTLIPFYFSQIMFYIYIIFFIFILCFWIKNFQDHVFVINFSK